MNLIFISFKRRNSLEKKKKNFYANMQAKDTIMVQKCFWI